MKQVHDKEAISWPEGGGFPMVDPSPNYLDDFYTQQTDPLSKHLIERFRRMVRSPDIPADDYPFRLRQAMDTFFQEMAHEAHQSDDP